MSDLDERSAPVSDVPAWADELSSWELPPQHLSPGDRAGYAYLIRVGRRIWEVRVAQRGAEGITEADLAALIDAVGESARAGTAAPTDTPADATN